jgi:hypothetical protein
MRMAFNVAVEGLVGMIPFAGDVFDAAFKANQRNIRLLNAWLDDPRRTTVRSRGWAFGVGAALVAFLLLLSVLGFLIARWLVNVIFN